MRVAFCGHADAVLKEEEINTIKNTCIFLIKNNLYCEFYLGGYGNFDKKCRDILFNLRKDYKNFKIFFVTPYLRDSYIKGHMICGKYDNTIYPPIENSPFKFAIEKRNKWIVDNSGLLICYIIRTYGGAYKMFNYAKKRIKYINVKSNGKD